MDDSTNPAVPPAIRCCIGFFFFGGGGGCCLVELMVVTFDFYFALNLFQLAYTNFFVYSLCKLRTLHRGCLIRINC